MKDGLIDPERTIQIGIRTCFSDERGEGIQVIGADEVHAEPAGEIANRILSRVGNGPAYLTFDIDCLDPTFAPGTELPYPADSQLTRHWQLFARSRAWILRVWTLPRCRRLTITAK
ncbi:MAG: arginase family protein, partial [Gammaproteobacteria bacterium]